jgi:TetR/AcrR family transcriptional repressor of nem operon
MRYDKGHKETTRQRILETAASRFRKDGIEGVGVADVMAEAGLTVGGFYSHFESKEDLVREAMNVASTGSRMRFDKRIEEGGLESWIRFYLSTGHRDHPEMGCSAAALGAELARHPESSRASFAENMKRVSDAIEAHLPKTIKPAERRKTAVGIFATCIGALQMARTVPDPKVSEQILEAGLATALLLAQIPHPRK